VLEAWRGFDLTGAIAALCPWPVIPCNDATAACAAELFSGRHHATPDFAYFYLGYFIGGGIVLNGSLFQGRGGNAGALGSMPVTGSDGKPQQLIRSASFYVLEKAMAKTGLDPDLLWRDQDDWSVAGDCLEAWIERAAAGIAEASAAIASVIECGAVIIDGAMPAPVRQRLTEAVIAALGTINCSGISRFAVKAGAIGRDARALGAASLPLFANYIIDRDVLFKEVV
jgi:predicted NBD/HSP70 family sugar kinase